MVARSHNLTGTVGANGTTTLYFRNTLTWELLTINQITVASILPSNVRTWLGDRDQFLISQTYLGQNDTDSNPNVALHPSEAVAIEWYNATMGDRVRATIRYTIEGRN